MERDSSRKSLPAGSRGSTGPVQFWHGIGGLIRPDAVVLDFSAGQGEPVTMS